MKICWFELSFFCLSKNDFNCFPFKRYFCWVYNFRLTVIFSQHNFLLSSCFYSAHKCDYFVANLLSGFCNLIFIFRVLHFHWFGYGWISYPSWYLEHPSLASFNSSGKFLGKISLSIHHETLIRDHSTTQVVNFSFVFFHCLFSLVYILINYFRPTFWFMILSSTASNLQYVPSTEILSFSCSISSQKFYLVLLQFLLVFVFF